MTLTPASTLLDRMFAAEMAFIESDGVPSDLACAFHEAVVIHEPASLPYAGDWRGLDGAANLFRAMREVWSDMKVEDLEAARDEELVYVRCRLTLTSRATGRSVSQPFAEVLRFRDDRLIEGTPFYFDTASLLETLA